MFLAACALYALCFRYCVGKLSGVIETALLRIRIRIAERIRGAELLGLEHIGTAAIHEQLTTQTSIISDAARAIAIGLQSTVLLGVTALYVGYVSLLALLLTVGVYGFTATYYYLRNAQTQELMKAASSTRMSLFEVIGDFLQGFKEVRLHTARSEDLQVEFSIAR
jgi:putative ATP-binding cassette transporter